MNSSHLGEIIPKQDKNQKIKIDKGNIDQGIIVPASSINNSSIGNRLIKNVLSGLDLKKSFCRKDNNLFWGSGKEKRNCILNDEEDESHIDVKLNIENRPVKNLDMRNKILFYLESHENGNSYS